MHIRRLLVGLAALGFIYGVGATASHAAPPPNITQTVGVCDPWFPTRCTQAGPFVPDASSTATLAVTTSSARVALPGTGATVVLTNNGSSDLYAKLGGSSVTAATTDLWVGAGRMVTIYRGSSTYIAGITGSGSSSLIVQTGNGVPAGGGGGGGGSSGSTTITGPLGSLAQAASVAVALDTVDAAALQSIITNVAASVPAGTNVIGSVGLAAQTTGGCTPGGAISTASTNATSVKSAAGTFCGGVAINTTATLAYIRWYNLAAAPTCSSATGYVASTPVPASATGAGTVLNWGAYGAAFTTGIAWCITGGGSSTDNTSAVAGVYVNYTFK